MDDYICWNSMHVKEEAAVLKKHYHTWKALTLTRFTQPGHKTTAIAAIKQLQSQPSQQEKSHAEINILVFPRNRRYSQEVKEKKVQLHHSYIKKGCSRFTTLVLQHERIKDCWIITCEEEDYIINCSWYQGKIICDILYSPFI